MILIIFWLFILFIFYNLYNTHESFNIINYQDIKYNIIQNYNPINYVDKNSFNQFKTYISGILNQFGIEKKKYFLKVIENNRYYLEIIIIFDDLLKKLIEVELLIKNNKIHIQNINFKNNNEILLDGFDMSYDNNFLMPRDFSWKENPVYQNIVFPNKINLNQRLTADNLEQLSIIIQNKNQKDILEAIKMADSTLKNRKSFYEQGFCFGTKIIGIDNKRDCELNFGTWDQACTKNEDCKFYKPEENARGGRGGCIEPGYCEFPKGVEKIGYTKEKKREQERINKLKLGSNYQFSNQIEFDIPSCYCDDPTNISPDCCYNKDYVF
jgi:hypothetical protein